MSVVDEFGRSKYISLTTYRKDGTGVATPVWHVVDGGELLVITPAESWKIKRIRKNSDVVVTVCNFRGQVAPDAPSARGTARLLDEAGTEAGRQLLADKYFTSRWGNRFAKFFRLRRPPMAGIVVSF